jgi:hypothetical protein
MTSTIEVSDEALSEDENALRQLAVVRLKKRRDFKAHVLVYVLVNSVIWGIWLVIALGSGGGKWWPWPIFPTLGWGIGLVLNGWDAYFRRPITNAEVENEVRRLRGAA